MKDSGMRLPRLAHYLAPTHNTPSEHGHCHMVCSLQTASSSAGYAKPYHSWPYRCLLTVLPVFPSTDDMAESSSSKAKRVCQNENVILENLQFEIYNGKRPFLNPKSSQKWSFLCFLRILNLRIISYQVAKFHFDTSSSLFVGISPLCNFRTIVDISIVTLGLSLDDFYSPYPIVSLDGENIFTRPQH